MFSLLLFFWVRVEISKSNFRTADVSYLKINEHLNVEGKYYESS